VVAVFLIVSQLEDVAGMTLKRAAHLFQSVEIHPEGLALLQTPKRRMADTGLFRQPIEGASLLGQYFIYVKLNNKARPPGTLLFITCGK
jgi:hypothetical protein